MIDKEKTALWQYCKLLYEEYLASKEHDYSPEAEKIREDIIAELQMKVHELDGATRMSFIVPELEKD